MNNLRIRNELHRLARDERDRQELEAASRMDMIIGVIGCAGLVVFLLMEYFA